MVTQNDTLTASRAPARVVMVGHVDHGKSTLVGQLLYSTGAISKNRIEAVARVCEDTGKPFEFAFLLDALEEERDQGITIDTMQVKFRSQLREYVLIDAPGHKEFLKNMVTGAASAEAAVLLIDAAEGIQEQSRRHGYLLHLLGIRQIVVVVNKMDLVGYSRETYDAIRDEYLSFLRGLGVLPQAVIPINAREGQNVLKRGDGTPWYSGPTLIEALDRLAGRPDRGELPLRLAVQDVYKFDERRIIAGRVASGSVAAGDAVIFSPSGRRAVVKSLERWSSPVTGPAGAGESVGLTLTEQLFIERGEVLSRASERAPELASQLAAQIFWLGERHLAVGRSYTLKLATQEVRCTIASIEEVTDAATLEAAIGQREVAKNEVARVTISLERPVAFDVFGALEETGRFVLVDGFDVAGGGIVLSAVEAGYSI